MRFWAQNSGKTAYAAEAQKFMGLRRMRAHGGGGVVHGTPVLFLPPYAYNLIRFQMKLFQLQMKPRRVSNERDLAYEWNWKWVRVVFIHLSWPPRIRAVRCGTRFARSIWPCAFRTTILFHLLGKMSTENLKYTKSPQLVRSWQKLDAVNFVCRRRKLTLVNSLGDPAEVNLG